MRPASGTHTARMSSDQPSAASTGCCIGQEANTTAQLRAAERQITEGHAKARRDIAEIVASN